MTKRKPEQENNFLEGGLNKTLKPSVVNFSDFDEVALSNADDYEDLLNEYLMSDDIVYSTNEENTPMDIDPIVTKNRITNNDLENILNMINPLNKINPKKTRTIDKDYLKNLLWALNEGRPDQTIQSKITKKTFEESVLTLYLLLEYGRDELFQNLQNAIQLNQKKIKVELTYLANICCQMNDSDNFQKLTSYKDYININSTMIHGININMQPCLKLAIQHTNEDLINKILHDYGNSINILAVRGAGLNVYETLLRNKGLRNTLDGLQIIQKVQKAYIKQILAKYPNPQDNQIASIAQEIKGKNGKSIIDDDIIMDIEGYRNKENTPINIAEKIQENNIVKRILNKINYKGTRTIDKEYLEGLLWALNNKEPDENVKKLYEEKKIAFEENVLTLYLLLEYGRNNLFKDIKDQITSNNECSDKKALTYLANICCQMNDSDNFQKLTSYKNYININSIKICEPNINTHQSIHMQPCLKLAIQYTNIDLINKILHDYGNSINIFAARGDGPNVYETLLKNYSLQKTLEGLLIIQRVQKAYIKQILAKYPNPEDNQIESIDQKIKEKKGDSIIDDDMLDCLNDIYEFSDKDSLSDMDINEIDDLYPEYNTGFLGDIDKFLDDIDAIEEV